MTHSTPDSLRKLAEIQAGFLVGDVVEISNALRQAADRIEELEKEKDDVLYQHAQMRGRLGQYEAQFAHDHNLYKATRIGELEARLKAATDCLRAIQFPDYVIKNDIVWAYDVLKGRMNMAKACLKSLEAVDSGANLKI